MRKKDLFKNRSEVKVKALDQRPAIWLSIVFFLLLTVAAVAQKKTVVTDAGDIEVETLAEGLHHPWGMAFLPDNRLLVTERAGTIRILDKNNKLSKPLSGTPEVFKKGQGGMFDVALHPDFKQNNLIYFTYAEPGKDSTATTALGRAKLQGNELKDAEVIFRMEPAVKGPNHFGGRIVFTNDGYLYLTLAERFKFEPAQDLSSHLGTVVRLNQDGSIPEDNPYVGDPNAKDAIWSYGHRNIESAAMHPETGDLWIAEMGPMGGDELNRPQPKHNYGWPKVSWGDNYDGTDIPDPQPNSEYADAVIHWTPTISPSGMIFYTGNAFPEWKNSMMIGGLTSTGIVRVQTDGENAKEVERIPLNLRIRDVEQAPDGTIYTLTDEEHGKILQLKPLSKRRRPMD